MLVWPNPSRRLPFAVKPGDRIGSRGSRTPTGSRGGRLCWWEKINRKRKNARGSGARRRRPGRTALFVDFPFVLELLRIAKAQNLPADVTRENAMGTLGLEGNDSHIPRARTIRRRNAAALQPFERFELEHGRGHGSCVVERTRRNIHTVSPVTAGSAISTPVIRLDLPSRSLVPSCPESAGRYSFSRTFAR